MKKIISLGLSLLLIIGCMALTVSAAISSPEIDDVISNIVVEDTDGNDVEVNFVRKDTIDDDMKPESADEKAIAQYYLKIDGNPQYPLSVKMNVAGIKKNGSVYIFAKDAKGDVSKLNATVLADNKITFTLDKAYDSISIVTDKKAGSQVGTSDQTGDSMAPVVFFLMVASLAVAVGVKKIKN